MTCVLKLKISLDQSLSTVIRTYTNHCAGLSSYTLWTIYSVDTITMLINTSKCAFPETPLYFTSVSGVSSQWYLIGYGAIYQPTNESFQIYARSFGGTYSSTVLMTWSQSFAWNIAACPSVTV
jgi:hypothetical protein